jgi:hypothetical protein
MTVEDEAAHGQIINHSDLFIVDSARHRSAKVDCSTHTPLKP